MLKILFLSVKRYAGCAENLSWTQQLEFLDAYINFQEHPEFLPVREHIANAIKSSTKTALQRPALSVMPSVRPPSSPKASLFPTASAAPQPQLASPLVLISPPFQPTSASQPVVSGTLSPMQFSLSEDSAGPAASPCAMPPPFKRSRMNLTPLFGYDLTTLVKDTDADTDTPTVRLWRRFFCPPTYRVRTARSLAWNHTPSRICWTIWWHTRTRSTTSSKTLIFRQIRRCRIHLQLFLKALVCSASVCSLHERCIFFVPAMELGYLIQTGVEKLANTLQFKYSTIQQAYWCVSTQKVLKKGRLLLLKPSQLFENILTNRILACLLHSIVKRKYDIRKYFVLKRMP